MLDLALTASTYSTNCRTSDAVQTLTYNTEQEKLAVAGKVLFVGDL